MKNVRLDVSPDIAKRILAEFEKDISAKTRQRDDLNSEISKLEENAKALRVQLQANGASSKAPTGENKRRVIEYLHGLGGKGARLSQMHKATGISISSLNFTLTHGGEFQKNKKLWKLKTDFRGTGAETERSTVQRVSSGRDNAP